MTFSAAKHTAALSNLKLAMKARETLPRCGAKRRTDGSPCAGTAMSNGRCYLHGGATPGGKDFHKVQFPKGRSEKWLRKKLKDLKRRYVRQAARVEAMTPEELARFDAWHAARKPGGPEVRRAAAQAREVRAMLAERASAAPVETPEAQALLEAIEALERQLEDLQKPPAQGPAPEDPFA